MGLKSLRIAGRMLRPLPGLKTPDSFQEGVRQLVRPYIPITEQDYKKLLAMPCDYYRLKDDRVVTFGSADGGFALMPLHPMAAQQVLRFAYQP